jgi:chloride channel protein, CIC family
VQLGDETFRKMVAGARVYFRRNWRRALRIRERLRFSEETFHLILAGGVGILGGVINLLFYFCTEWITQLLLRHTGDPVEVAEILRPWQLLVTPALGGLAAGFVLHLGLRLVGQKGTSNLLEVVVAGDGRLPFRVGIIKTLSSLLSIGSGASIGREGAIVQLTATLASKGGQLGNWQPYRLRLLVACGAASGIAAAYNAPVAGAVFAALIVLGNFSMNMFAPLVFASVISSIVSRSFFGLEPRYVVPAFEITRLTQLPWFLLLGILAGAAGAVFLKMLHWCEDRFQRLPLPIYARLALGGLVVGIIALGYPGVWGNGYVMTNRILHGQYLGQSFPLVFLTGLVLAKLLATLTTVGSGAVGGVFTPTLFLGAGLGCVFGTALHELGEAGGLPTGAFALVGMGSMLAATTHSPLLAMILVFEISLNYPLMPPLMLACVVSSLLARRLHPESIYTAPLQLKHLTADRESTRMGAATERTVGELMREPVPPLRETVKLRKIAERFLSSANNFLPVVDAKQRLLGIVALQDLKEYLNAGEEMSAVIAYDVMRPPPPCVTPNQRLLDALPTVLASEQRNVPVVNSFKEYRLVGAVDRAEVLGLLSEAIAAGSRTKT